MNASKQNTSTEHSIPTQAELRVKVAELHGLKRYKRPYDGRVFLCRDRPGSWDVTSDPIDVINSDVPDFPSDLNAMHEAEGTLGLNRCDDFEEHLRAIVGRDLIDRQTGHHPNGKVADLFYWHANARQRAEAFVATIKAPSVVARGQPACASGVSPKETSTAAFEEQQGLQQQDK